MDSPIRASMCSAWYATVVLLLLALSSVSNAATDEWISRDGRSVANADKMKSADGFGGWLIITDDAEWESKWNTPPDTTPHFSEAYEVGYGEEITILTLFGNPRADELGNIDIRCDIKVSRPNGSVSVNMKDIVCAAGKLQGNPRNVRMSSAVMHFIGEENDPPGTWKVNVTLTDQNRDVLIPLESEFELTRNRNIRSNQTTNSTFKSHEDVGNWMMYYYMNPKPDGIVGAIEYMSHSGLLDNKNTFAPVFGFLSGVFKDNPNRVEEWVGRLSSLKESHLGVVVLGL